MSLSLWNNDAALWSDPFEGMHRMERDLDRLFQRTAKGEVWKPHVDIGEKGDNMLVHAELPGVKKEDINVELNNGILTIKGEKRNEKKERKHGEQTRREKPSDEARSTPKKKW